VEDPAAADPAPIPISCQEWVKGALAIESRERRFRRDLDVRSRLADLAAAALEHAEKREQSGTTLRSTVELLAGVIRTCDRATGDHSDEVVALALAVGRRMGLRRGALLELEFAAQLHDLGKIGIPDAILHKPAPLDDDEWRLMRTHPVLGAELLRQVPGLVTVAEVVRSAHERWDGLGYPDGLRGREIPLASRIIFACDAFEAMTTDRPYKAARKRADAIRELHDHAGTQFDPAVVAALLGELEPLRDRPQGRHPGLPRALARGRP
jgi:HD-GYP domain-containing protein (c-di-GMP phosphodiesterase class II)